MLINATVSNTNEIVTMAARNNDSGGMFSMAQVIDDGADRSSSGRHLRVRR